MAYATDQWRHVCRDRVSVSGRARFNCLVGVATPSREVADSLASCPDRVGTALRLFEAADKHRLAARHSPASEPIHNPPEADYIPPEADYIPPEAAHSQAEAHNRNRRAVPTPRPDLAVGRNRVVVVAHSLAPAVAAPSVPRD